MEAKKTALDKLWNLLILLIVGEVTTAFHYGREALPWLIAGLGAFILLLIGIALLSSWIEREER